MTRPNRHAAISAIACAVLAAGLAPMALSAQEWSGQATAYGWGAGVKGDFTPLSGAPTLSFDKSLSEVLEDLDGAFFLTGLARRGDLVLFADYTYSASSRDGRVPPGIPASGEVTLQSLTLAAGNRFTVADGGTIDVLGGLRAWIIEGRVSVPLAGVDVAPEKSFVDPIIGLRANAVLSDRWSLLGYADVGGFGVGSELTWQAAVTANFQATDNLFISAGWRELYLDYTDGGTEFDGSMVGPVIGATWTF
ncbi:hypothetical protein [Yoonia vestfoldensis]|uniref:hypothetical protein n=1 Tax=Yoonia vestfoldensis TaxID=245188 RepID=UPI0003A8ECFC|nr:hypothetical protein [Yoonia vestfoldensis]